MRQGRAVWLAAGAALALVWATQAWASVIDYSFQATVTSGPLNGQAENGSFSYNSSSITPGATNNATGLLTALNFTLNGITYSAATANTGSLTFDAAGNLASDAFGNKCTAGNCGVTFGTNEFFIDGPTLVYATPGTGNVYSGTVTYAEIPVSVPEPSSLALLGTALLAVGFVALRRQQN